MVTMILIIKVQLHFIHIALMSISLTTSIQLVSAILVRIIYKIGIMQSLNNNSQHKKNHLQKKENINHTQSQKKTNSLLATNHLARAKREDIQNNTTHNAQVSWFTSQYSWARMNTTITSWES